MAVDDPMAGLWLHAMRAELDAVVLRFEAQLKQHVASSAGAHRAELDAARRATDEAAMRTRELDAKTAALTETLAQRDAKVAALTESLKQRDDEVARLKAALSLAETAARTQAAALDEARGRLSELGSRVQSLDEQFVTERAFVRALSRVAGAGLYEAAAGAFGASFDESPASLGALKAKKCETILAAAVRERGRSVTRNPLTREERDALVGLAELARCVLLDVPAGTRFASATMEKVATRAEPAEEDHVLECLMPGLRLGDSQGAVVHPKVVVATA